MCGIVYAWTICSTHRHSTRPHTLYSYTFMHHVPPLHACEKNTCTTLGNFLQQSWDPVWLKLAQPTTPIAKFRVFFDANFCVDRWTSLVLNMHENTIPSIPPRHHRNTAKTPQKDPKSPDTVKTLQTHHQSATKTPTTTETKLTDHQDTQFPKGPAKGVSPKKCYRHTLWWYCFPMFPITIFSHHHQYNTAATTSSKQQQHHHHHHRHHPPSPHYHPSSTIIHHHPSSIIHHPWSSPPTTTTAATTTTTTSSLFIFGKFQFAHLQNEIHRCTCRYDNVNLFYWRRCLGAGA